MIRLIVAALLSTCLAACGIARQIELAKEGEQAAARRNAAYQECERLHPDKHKKPVVIRIRCFNEANLAFARGMSRTLLNFEPGSLLVETLYTLADGSKTGAQTGALI